MGRDSADAEDVAQEAALTVLSALPTFRGESSVVRFATSIAALVAMNARRKRAAAKRGGGVSNDSSEIEALIADSDAPDSA